VRTAVISASESPVVFNFEKASLVGARMVMFFALPKVANRSGLAATRPGVC
jgi:hypothetical protein